MGHQRFNETWDINDLITNDQSGLSTTTTIEESICIGRVIRRNKEDSFEKCGRRRDYMEGGHLPLSVHPLRPLS